MGIEWHETEDGWTSKYRRYGLDYALTVATTHEGWVHAYCIDNGFEGRVYIEPSVWPTAADAKAFAERVHSQGEK